MFGDVEIYQRQLDRIAGILDGDDEDAMADLVQGESLLLQAQLALVTDGQHGDVLPSISLPRA